MAIKGTDTLASIAEADAAQPFDSFWAGIAEAEREAYLRMATTWIGTAYVWAGHRTDPAQPLPWPRVGVRSLDGRFVPSDSIPTPVTFATVLLARRLAVDDLTADDVFEDRGIMEASGVKVEPGRVSRTVIPGQVRDVLTPTFHHGLRPAYRPRATHLGRLTDGR